MDNEKLISYIIEMFQRFDESDNLFLKQVYTIVKKHLERKGRR